MARPPKEIDEALVFRMARAGATTEQIARACSVSVDTIDRRYADELRKIKADLHTSLLAKQVELALAGDKTMLIWLGKQHLGQREPYQTQQVQLVSPPVLQGQLVEAEKIPPARLLELLPSNQKKPT